MSEYHYTIKDNTVQAIGFEKELAIYDFADWEKDIITYLKAMLAMKLDAKYAELYLNQMFFSEDTSLIDGALINSAIQLLVKCFSNPSGKGRTNLNAKKVFRNYARKIGEEDLTKQFSQYYKARNEVISHDQSNYLDNIIGLTVNRVTGQAEDVAEITVKIGYLYKQNQELLLRMVRILLSFLESQIETIKQTLIEKYNNLPEKPVLDIVICDDIPKSTVW